jgi:MFS family permease
MPPSSTAARLGPIALQDGISRSNALTFLYAAFIGITLNTFVNFFQPYVLTEQLGIPESQQGKMSGDLVFYAEMMLLFACALAGNFADRFGRRLTFSCGFLMLSVCFALYGFVEQYSHLLLLRMMFAFGVGFINVMVSTVQADYPREESRGKLVGISGFAIGLGAMFLVFVLAPMPSKFLPFTDALWAGRYTALTVAAIAALSALVAAWGLAGDRKTGIHAANTGILESLHHSLQAARENPRIALAFACAFVARGDLIVVGVFFTLWLTQEGIANGLSSADAIKQAGLFFGLIQGISLLWAPVAGYLNDRVDRVTATAAGLGLAAIGYGSLGLITDPLGPWMYVCAVLLGIGQMSVMLTSQTLIGQEAPAERRGALMGAFSISGALGIMFVTKVGGWLFDSWKSGPFVIVAAANILLLCVALYMRKPGKHGDQ